MKVYLYTYQYEQIKNEGYKSLSLLDKTSDLYRQRLHVYDKNAESNKIEDILAYLEETFPGRLRSVCVITEMAPVREYKHSYLNYLVHHANVLSFDLEQLITDGIVEAIYCKDNKDTILEKPYFENIYQVSPEQIKNTTIDWQLCETEKYKTYSPWSTIKHYFLVLKEGYIPSKYITLERKGARENKV